MQNHIYRNLNHPILQLLLITACWCSFFIFSPAYAQSAADTTKTTFRDSSKIYSLPNKSRYYPILYGQYVKDENNISSLGFLQGREFESTPASSVYHALSGRLAGLLAVESSGIPGNGNNSLILRGNSPLILVDGIVRQLSSINPEQIESVTLLKDAISTVMLGQRSLNGALLITTKKGSGRKNYAKFNIQAQTGVQAPVVKRAYLNAFDYATLYNEALANDGRLPVYTDADLQAYKNHSDPVGHPDVDWYHQIYKNNMRFSRYTLNAEGNNKALSYLVSLDYLNQSGPFNEMESNSYRTSSGVKRYVLRSNINFDATKKLNVFVNIFAGINTSEIPGNGDIGAITSGVNLTANNAYPVFNPNGSLSGNLDYTTNLWGRSVFSGYTQGFDRQAFFDTGLKYKLDDFVKGLWLSSKISINSYLSLLTNRSKSFEVYSYAVSGTGNETYTALTNKTNQSNFSSNTQNQTFYTELVTGYSRSFGKGAVEAMLVANLEKYNELDSTKLIQDIGILAARVKYVHDEKYIAEIAASYAGNNYYAEGHKYGFFPALALGWNMHKEGFMRKLGFINSLKIRGSIGLTALQQPGYFENRYTYGQSNGYNFNNTGVAGIYENGIPTIRTYTESLKGNIGVDATFASNRAWMSIDYFDDRQNQILIAPRYVSSLAGQNYPLLNIGKNEFRGVELNLGWSDNIGKRVRFDISGNISTSKGKVIENGEPGLSYQWLQYKGQYVDQIYGYLADGFITTAGSGPVVAGYRSLPGDIRYRDLDGNGIIDQNDRTAIGGNRSKFFYGLNSHFSFDNFYISFLFQGVGNSVTMLTGITEFPFQDNGKAQAYPENINRWTPATAATATFPRLSIGNNPNNYVASSFWLQNTSYLRLKNLEIGCNLSEDILKKLKIKSMRVFVNGANIFTVSKFKRFDPETPTADYALLKTINGGVSVTF